MDSEKLEEAVKALEPHLTIAERVRIKLNLKKKIITTHVETLETQLFKARLDARIVIKKIETTIEVVEKGGFISMHQHKAQEVKSGFTSIEELILYTNVPFVASRKLIEPAFGDVVFKVLENGMLEFYKANYDSTDSGRYNTQRF